MEKPEQKNIEKNKYIFHLIAKTGGCDYLSNMSKYILKNNDMPFL